MPAQFLRPLLVWLVVATGVAAGGPNTVLTVIADDFGWNQAGWNNPRAPTPHLTAIARSGVVLRHHYAYQVCSPTRSAFLSGRLPHHVNEGQSETTHLGGVDLRIETITERLKRSGSWTCAGVDWGRILHLVQAGQLGAIPSAVPLRF